MILLTDRSKQSTGGILDTHSGTELKHTSRVTVWGTVVAKGTQCRPSACLCWWLLMRQMKSRKETLSFVLENLFFLSFLDIFFFWRGKKKWIFEMWNFLSCKIKTILFWHCQNEARWLDFSILSNVFSEQNTQLNQGEYAGSLFFFFVKQFCSPAPLFCCFYSIVKSLIWRQPKPNQSLTSPPAHSNQTPWEKWNFLGCYSGLFSQECFHTKGKTS